MTNQEMLAALKGSAEQKQSLYDHFSAKIAEGQALEENEIPLFEAVRKLLTKKSEVVTISGHATGLGGAKL